MDFELQPFGEEDLDELTRVMTETFDDDSRRFAGLQRGGPPGYDDGTFLRTWGIKNRQSTQLKIIVDKRIVGALILWHIPDGISCLGTIFIAPAYQSLGLGRAVWAWIERQYPTKGWRLETPVWAGRNHHFYENCCGFVRSRVNKGSGDEPDQVLYCKGDAVDNDQ